MSRETAPARGPVDLRLAGTALGCWLAALASLRMTMPYPIVLAVLAAGGAAALAHRAGARRDPAVTGRARCAGTVEAVGWIVAATLLGAVVGAAATAARVAQRDAEPLAGLARRGAAVRAALVVGDDPRPIRSTGATQTLLVPGRLVWFESVDRGRVRSAARILVLAGDDGWSELLPGQRLEAEGVLATARGGDLTAAVLLVRAGPAAVSRAPLVQRAAGGLRAGLRRACSPLPADVGGLLPGLVVGDTGRLDPALAGDFRTTGLTHLVAVSGSNCAIVVGAVLLLTSWCRLGPRLSAGSGALALAGFVVLVRPSPSVLRAAAMGGVALIALAGGRSRAAVPALGATVAVLVCLDPGLAGAAGFALSVLATAGLLLLAPGWSVALRRLGVPRGAAEALAVPAAAQAACAPVIAALSASVSITAVPANLLAAPAVAPATMLGVGAALLSPLWPTGAAFAAWLGSWPARWLVWLAHAGAAVPGGLLPWPGGTGGGLLLAGVLAALILAARVRLLRRLVPVFALAAVVGVLPVRLVLAGWPPPGWFVVVCDVGQGDAIAVRAGPGAAVVVDAGPEPEGVDDCLRDLGIRTVPLLLITHFHADHVGGVDGVLRGHAVGAVLVAGSVVDEAPTRDGPTARAETTILEGAPASAAVPAAGRAGVPVLTTRPGLVYAAGAARIEILGPVRRRTGTHSDANNNSLVAVARVGGRSVLLTGDAEVEEQEDLLGWERSGQSDGSPAVPLRADVLKVAHHGSQFQHAAFLDAVDPTVALVSVGADNDYGQPNLPTLELLARDGALVRRTDLVGDIAVAAGGSTGMTVTTHRRRLPGRGP